MWRIPSDSCRGLLFFLDFERGNMGTAYRLLTLIMTLPRVSTSPGAPIPLSHTTLSPLANLRVGMLTVKTVPLLVACIDRRFGYLKGKCGKGK
jgi:hypothetical protein